MATHKKNDETTKTQKKTADPRSSEDAQSLNLVLGKVIEQFRKDRELTQAELAEKAGIHATALSKIERGKTSASVSTLYRLADALGVLPEEILRRERMVEDKMQEVRPELARLREAGQVATTSTNWLGLLGKSAGVGAVAGAVGLMSRSAAVGALAGAAAAWIFESAKSDEADDDGVDPMAELDEFEELESAGYLGDDD